MPATAPRKTMLPMCIKFPRDWQLALKQHAATEGSDVSTLIRNAVAQFMRDQGIHPAN